MESLTDTLMTRFAGKPDLLLTLGALVLGALVVGAVGLAAQQGDSSRPPAPPSCDADSTYHALDFWVGSWKVYEAGKEVGTNRIEKILGGCAVVENWKDAEGGEGRSLFYVQPTTGRWRQVWVTDQATAPGGLKEKVLVTRFPSGGTRFQGEIVRPGGRVVLDRTTLTPEPDGRVRQVIEISRDGGDTWQATFDAIYVRAR